MPTLVNQLSNLEIDFKVSKEIDQHQSNGRNHFFYMNHLVAHPQRPACLRKSICSCTFNLVRSLRNLNCIVLAYVLQSIQLQTWRVVIYSTTGIPSSAKHIVSAALRIHPINNLRQFCLPQFQNRSTNTRITASSSQHSTHMWASVRNS